MAPLGQFMSPGYRSPVMQSLGRYEIIEQLGRGSMGTVYKARDPMIGRDVAIKTIQTRAIEGTQATEFRVRFFQEAKAAGKLAHPGIVTIFDVSEHERTPFLVMEYVGGQTLQSLLENKVRLDLDHVCDLGIQLGEALDYAHRNGVIHRDIKPANILVTNDGRAKITDFGIAKLNESAVTSTGQLLGTPAFMAPEQFTGQPIDARADLFAVAAVIYCIATGERPFTGDTLLSIQYKVVQTDPVPPRKLNPAIVAGLESVILKGIEKDPSQRYQSGEEFAEDLRAVRAGRTLVAKQQAKTIQPSVGPSDREGTEVLTARGDVSGQKSKGASLAVLAAVLLAVFALITFTLGGTRRAAPVASAPLIAESRVADNPDAQRKEAEVLEPLVTKPPVAEPPPLTAVIDVPSRKTSERPAIRRVATPRAIDASPRSVPTTATDSPREPLEHNIPALSPQPAVISLPVADNRNLVAAVPQPEVNPPYHSAELLITSLDLPAPLTVIVTADSDVLLRGRTTPPKPGVPLAELRSLPPGEHTLRVSVMQGIERVGKTWEVTSRFYAGQRRTLQISFPPDAQRSGRDDREAHRFRITLK